MNRGARETATTTAAALAAGGIHVAIFVLFALGDGEETEAEPPVEALEVVDVEILRWGEELPEEGELPRIANPEEVPQPDELPDEVPAPDEEAQPNPAETVSVEAPEEIAEDVPEEQLRAEAVEREQDAPEVRYRGPSNPHRPANTETVPGSSVGMIGGRSVDADAVEAQLLTILSQLNNEFSPPSGVSDEELNRLVAEFVIQVDERGEITDFRLRRPSGKRSFDFAAMRAFRKFQDGRDYLDMGSITNTTLRSDIVQRGLRVNMSGEGRAR